MILENKQSKKKGGARAGAGHPPKALNWAEIDTMAEKQWNQKQLAALAGCDVKTLGWSKLLSKQYDMALDGSVPLLIFLGKNYLGQSDKQHIEQDVSANITSNLNLKNLTDEELKSLNLLIKKAGASI